MMPESKHLSFHKKNNKNMLGKYHSEKTKNEISEKRRLNNGEKSPNHKLTEEQVIQIKLLLKEGILTQQEIAYMFGVSRLTISAIKNNRIWSYIGDNYNVISKTS
jgi:DNA invertase Pin-like site-specific DNA recombinase